MARLQRPLAVLRSGAGPFRFQARRFIMVLRAIRTTSTHIPA